VEVLPASTMDVVLQPSMQPPARPREPFRLDDSPL
jgi:hypothetical protein